MKGSKNKTNKLLVAFAALLLIVGVVVTVVVLLGVAMPHQQSVVTHSSDRPDETKPGKDYKWQGTAEDPKYIKLPSINSEGYIQNVGVDQHNAVAAPSNIHIAGWFTKSARPGQEGLSIIDGHVSGWTSSGIFKKLGTLKIGDNYTIQMGSGKVLKYKVLKVDSVETDKAAAILYSQDPNVRSQLNLITCGGQFDKRSNQYQKRIIITSSLE
jgi:LPXTG-site transpeptidase (sortase) family protein